MNISPATLDTLIRLLEIGAGATSVAVAVMMLIFKK
jgi:hypothetical protein